MGRGKCDMNKPDLLDTQHALARRAAYAWRVHSRSDPGDPLLSGLAHALKVLGSQCRPAAG